MKMDGVDSYPLHWPMGWPRTKEPQASRFDGTFARMRDDLMAEIERLGGRYIVLSTNVALKRDGMPYAAQKDPTDPGVAVYFERRGRTMVFACDKWTTVKDNMRAIQKTIDAIRGIERWGASEMMERAFQAFEALPPPADWASTLGVSRAASREDVEAAYREKAKSAHPDRGGTSDAMAALTKARDEALRAISSN